MPLRLGRYGSAATENDIAMLIGAVANLGSDAAADILAATSAYSQPLTDRAASTAATINPGLPPAETIRASRAKGFVIGHDWRDLFSHEHAAAFTVAKVAQLGSPRRLRIIYDTNLRSAYAAGRWQRIQCAKQRLPFLRYSAVQDNRVRPHHAAWHGTILHADHPF